MYIILSLLLTLSIAGNVILVWYTRKLIQNMQYGIANIDEMQKLFEEYVSLLQPLATMDNYYGDPAITSAVNNTKLVIDACRVYKKTMIEDYYEENQENQDGPEAQKDSIDGTEASEKVQRKATATIGPISANVS